MNITSLAQKAKLATYELLGINEDERRLALEVIALNLIAHEDLILEENQKDLKLAAQNKLNSAMINRLTLTEKSIRSLSEMCLAVADQPKVVGEISENHTRPNGLIIQKQRVPIGVIGMIFESRPNVVVDAAALGIKSGNAMILKGGKEAQHSNRILFEIISASLSSILPDYSINLIETREDVGELLKLNQYIDLMVPRGGSELVQYVKNHATMPVVAHDKGLCHIYVHHDAKKNIVIPVILNAKTQRPGVCNALESLLLHRDYPYNSRIIEALINSEVEIRGCEETQKLYPGIKLAKEADYGTEYLDLKISVKIVKDEDEAISHIQKYSSHHTEAILTETPSVAERFLNSLDASCLVVNASTRFNDGGELGLGAELGISTSKLHAYGPMGAREMTTTRFLVKGSGQTRV